MANYNTGGMFPAEVYDAHACGKGKCCLTGNPHAAQRLALRALKKTVEQFQAAQRFLLPFFIFRNIPASFSQT